MHPQLIPERHPMCGKYMEALVKCREANPYRRFWGVCNDHTYDLTKCLVEEKKEFRAPRQAKFHEKWAAKKEADAQRMAELEAQAEARAAAKADGSSSGASSSSAGISSASGSSTTGSQEAVRAANGLQGQVAQEGAGS